MLTPFALIEGIVIWSLSIAGMPKPFPDDLHAFRHEVLGQAVVADGEVRLRELRPCDRPQDRVGQRLPASRPVGSDAMLRRGGAWDAVGATFGFDGVHDQRVPDVLKREVEQKADVGVGQRVVRVAPLPVHMDDAVRS